MFKNRNQRSVLPAKAKEPSFEKRSICILEHGMCFESNQKDWKKQILNLSKR